MKNKLIGILCFFITAKSFAQGDDIPNYRSTRDNFKKITQQTVRADIAAYALAGIDESQNKTPLPSLKVSAIEKNFIEWRQDSFYVKITSTPFIKEKHKLLYYEEKYLVKIDNKGFWGTANILPLNSIALVLVVIGKDTVNIPQAAYNDLYEPSFSYYDKNAGAEKTHNAVYLSKDGSTLYIYMINSDGNSMYEVTWVIQNKTYLRRVVDWGFQN